MAERRLKNMKVSELFRKILNGERDLSGVRVRGIEFKDGRHRYHTMHPMEQYLRGHIEDLTNHRLTFDGSVFERVDASGLYLPYVSAKRAMFKNCNMQGASCFWGDFEKAHFYGTNLHDGKIRHSYLGGAVMEFDEMDPRKTYGLELDFSDLDGARFIRADMRHVKGTRSQNYENHVGTARFVDSWMFPSQQRYYEEAGATVSRY